jgi:hypothetical protein
MPQSPYAVTGVNGVSGKSLLGAVSDAEITTAMVGMPPVTVTLGSPTNGDFHALLSI